MSHTVYFISHPEVDIQPEVPVPQWSLSSTGIRRMKQALALPWIKQITAIYSSNEKKACDGAEILSAHLNLAFSKVEDLGENDRTSTGFLVPDKFEAMADSFFNAPHESISGWERAIDAQRRIFQAVSDIDQRDTSTGAIAIVSHGAVGTLLYCYLTDTAISRQFDQPGAGGGNYLKLSLTPQKHCDWWQTLT